MMEMMNFAKKNQKKIVFLAVILFFISLNFFGKQIKNIFYLGITPFQKGLFSVSQKTTVFFGSIFNLAGLVEQNQKLEQENQSLKGELVNLREVEIENQLLRSALGLEMQKEFELLLAEVLVKDLGQDVILINKGSRDNVAGKMLVVSAQRALIGEVSEVYSNFSRVKLISDKDSAFPAKIQEIGVTGTLKGGGNGQLFLDRLEQTAEVQPGQLVVTAGLDGRFPRGLLLGEIKITEKSDLASFQKAVIRPSFNFQSVSSLFVILDFTPFSD